MSVKQIILINLLMLLPGLIGTLYVIRPKQVLLPMVAPPIVLILDSLIFFTIWLGNDSGQEILLRNILIVGGMVGVVLAIHLFGRRKWYLLKCYSLLWNREEYGTLAKDILNIMKIHQQMPAMLIFNPRGLLGLEHAPDDMFRALNDFFYDKDVVRKAAKKFNQLFIILYLMVVASGLFISLIIYWLEMPT